jgi:hypothetical protein
VHGRDDGITFFGKNNSWGQRTPQTSADASCRSDTAHLWEVRSNRWFFPIPSRVSMPVP